MRRSVHVVKSGIMPAPGYSAVFCDEESGKVTEVPLVGWALVDEENGDARYARFDGFILSYVGVCSVEEEGGFVGYKGPGETLEDVSERARRYLGPRVTEGEYGVVVVIDGENAGRTGYYDDDGGKGAVVFFDCPTTSRQDFAEIPFANLAPAPEEETAQFGKTIMRCPSLRSMHPTTGGSK